MGTADVAAFLQGMETYHEGVGLALAESASSVISRAQG